MRHWLLALELYCTAILGVYGETIVITGKVKKAGGETVQNIPVILEDALKGNILSYTYTDGEGNYRMNYAGTSNDLKLTVSGLGIETIGKRIERRSQTVDFTVKSKEVSLREVVIKPTKIWYRKDTINYNVSSFMMKKDFTIGDVLKRMPGIDVSKSGQISYMGKPINKFYIENLDMLNGRYDLATNNITAKEVSTVQVLENHQPIKALDDSLHISDRAAINLKLKNSAKGTFGVNAQAGIGVSPILWENELTGMYFTKTRQNMETYKGNNDGKDLSDELTSFSSDFNPQADEMTNIYQPVPPNIDKRRYYFNNSNALTSNNLFTVGKDRTLNFNLIYYNDHERRHSRSYSSYYLSNDSTLRVDDESRSSDNTDLVMGEVNYTENSKAKYLNDYLRLKGSWTDARGDILDKTELGQRLYRPSYSAANTLHMVKNGENGGYEYISRIGFIGTPQDLTLSPGPYADFFNSGSSYSSLRQDGRTNYFTIRNFFRPMKLIPSGKVRIDPIANLNMDVNGMSSELYPRNEYGEKLNGETPDSMRNDLQRIDLDASLGFSVEYKVGNLAINGLFSFAYDYYRLNNSTGSKTSLSKNLFFLKPSLKLKYRFSQMLEMDLEGNRNQTINGIFNLFEGYVMQDYRTLERYGSQFAQRRVSDFALSLKYKDILNLFFAEGEIARSFYRNDLLYSSSYRGIMSILSTAFLPNTSISSVVNGKLSKGFDFMKLTVGLEGSYGISSSRRIVEEREIDYKNNNLNIKGKLSAEPFSILTLSYEGEWNRNHTKVDEANSFRPIRSFSNTFNADVNLFSTLSLGAQHEMYYNSAVQGNRNLSFTDLNLSYKLRNIDFLLDWTNIFDTKQYLIAYYSGLNEYRYDYDIRPANVMLKVKFKIK